jgi:hypothetical protein
MPEIIGIKSQTIKQEFGFDVTTAVFGLVSSYTKHRDTATLRASLKSYGRIEFLSTGNTPALAFTCHGQQAVALRTTMAEQHNVVEERSSLPHEHSYSFCHIKGK